MTKENYIEKVNIRFDQEWPKKFESASSAYERAQKVKSKIHKLDSKAAIVAHKNFLRYFTASELANNAPVKGRTLENCQVYTIDITDQI